MTDGPGFSHNVAERYVIVAWLESEPRIWALVDALNYPIDLSAAESPGMLNTTGAAHQWQMRELNSLDLSDRVQTAKTNQQSRDLNCKSLVVRKCHAE